MKNAGDQVNLDTGKPLSTDAVGENVIIFMVPHSYWLSRDLINDEGLDWSHCADPNGDCETVNNVKGPCTSFMNETSPDTNLNALNEHTCYFLDFGPQVSQVC